MQESYDKRLNLLIHGIEESDDWETLKKTKKLIHYFMKDGLLIQCFLNFFGFVHP